MSGMWGWFGGGSSTQTKKNSPKEAILQLRAQLTLLQKREGHLQSQADEQDAIARKNISTNKMAARNALKRKKQHESSLEQTAAQISTLEQQIYSIEAANINRETLIAMEKAGKAMASIHGPLSIEKVDETMEKLREQHALSQEIANAITQAPLGEQVDEGVLEDELAELEQEALDDKMLRTGNVPVSDQIHRLPAAATGEVKGKAPIRQEEDDDEEELRKLQAEMAT